METEDTRGLRLLSQLTIEQLLERKRLIEVRLSSRTKLEGEILEIEDELTRRRG
jgi:hypothetical protein